jgi:hypothetical protein
MKQEYIVIILSLLLLLFLTWKEIKRANRSRLALRLFMTILAVISLVFVFIPLRFTRQTDSPSTTNIVLITPGAEKEADSLSHYKHITTDQQLSSATIGFTPDLSLYISQHHDEIGALHIMGNGIADHEWKMLQEYKINTSYTPSRIPTGIIKADWPRSIASGSQMRVQGIYNNAGNDEVKLVLYGLGTSIDSVMIRKDSTQSFSMRCQPSHHGSILYELQSVRNGRIIATEKIPVNIHPVIKPAVLLLSSSPGFESRFLGSWLYENGYPVAIRNTVSRDKYDHQFLNMKAISLNNINAALLESFDLLIADDNALAELSPSSSASLKAQLEKGMGLIIQSDSSRSLSSFSRSFNIQKQAARQASTRALSWSGSTSSKNQLSADEWFTIQRDPFAQQLVTDEHQSTIASCRLYGAGRMILNTAGSTYSWILSGATESYSSFWSLLISKSARSYKKETVWLHSPGFPVVDQPVKLTLEQNITGLPVIKTNSGDLYTEQTPYLPDTWTANWWPATPGWQTLSSTDTVSIYVFEDNDWVASREMAQINKNILQAEVQQSNINTKNRITTETRSVPVWFFYAGLLIACSFLWWEKKAAE